MKYLSYSAISEKYAHLSQDDFQMRIADRLRQQKIKIIVLDDDPTGIQTVHDCLLITDWTPQTLIPAFKHPMPFFYLLTNTRAMTKEQAAKQTRSAMEAVLKVSENFAYKLVFISRSDSTLRGHFPLETDVMRQVLKEHNINTSPITFFIPAFIEAGRYTINGVQYLKKEDELIPVSESEFARDTVFGYHHANLEEYINEKTGGETSHYHSFSLDNFHSLTEEERFKKGEALLRGIIDSHTTETEYISVDALNYSDLGRFAISFLQWINNMSACVIFRTSSSFPKALGGIDDINLLSKKELISQKGTGLFIIGSHVKKSSTQLQNLLLCDHTQGIELDVNLIFRESESLLRDCCRKIQQIVDKKKTPVIFTSREEIRMSNPERRQMLGQDISKFLVSVVRNLPYQPNHIVAKGGITSHDILTKGLEVRSAEVLGQILEGVPCLKTNISSPIPNTPYIIFPGNVGEEDSLAKIFRLLSTDGSGR